MKVTYTRLAKICFAIIFIFLNACSNEDVTLGQSPLLRFVERKSGRIAIMSTDGNIYTMDQAGSSLVAVTEDASVTQDNQELVRYYQFPAWAPDDSRLAFVGYQGDNRFASITSVFTTSSDGTNVTQAFSSGQHIPHNLYWSPNGEWLTFLTSTAGRTASALNMVPAEGGAVIKLDAGIPFYWSWAPDSQTIAVHAGDSGLVYHSRLAFLNVEGTIYEERMPVTPALFQTPSWSPDGSLLLAARVNNEAELVITNRNGSLYQAITRVDAGLTFSWSPNGKKIAYLTRNRNDPDTPGNLMIVNVTALHSEPVALTENNFVLGFFWSPDGEKIAYFVPGTYVNPEDETQKTLFLTLHIYDFRKNATREIHSFVPTAQFLTVVRQFDQFYLSTRLWSPDSRNFLFAELSNQGAGIMVARTSGNIAPRQIADGLVGFWSWR